MIDVSKTSRKHYTKANSIITKRSSKLISKNASINNDIDKKEEEDSKISSIQNKINPFMRNSIKASTSINKMNYDTNHSTNNNIISLDIKNIDSLSEKEHNLTPKLRDLNSFTIQNINKAKENNDNYDSNYQKNIKNLITMDFNFNFDEDQKNFEQESDILTKSDMGMTSLLRKSTYKEFDEPSWIEELIQISNEKTNKINDIPNLSYLYNILSFTVDTDYTLDYIKLILVILLLLEHTNLLLLLEKMKFFQIYSKSISNYFFYIIFFIMLLFCCI